MCFALLPYEKAPWHASVATEEATRTQEGSTARTSGYFFLLASIVVHSIVGIHYLQERIHREPPKPDAHEPAAKNSNGQSLNG